MRQPSDLTKEELVDIVTQIRELLWPEATPDCDWEVDTIEDVAQVLIEHEVSLDLNIDDQPTELEPTPEGGDLV
jgi:hypothetical protein